MNNNIIDFIENGSKNEKIFDFNSDWDNDFVSVDDDDEIIIEKQPENEIKLDSSLEDDKILRILNDEPETKEKVEEKKEEKKEPMNFKDETIELDSFFDSIYNGVEDANELISQINLKKQTLQETEKEIEVLKNQIAREKEEFSKYMDSQKQALELEKKQLKEKSELQRLRLSEESEQVKNDAEVKTNELNLKEQKVKVEQEKLAMQKVNFEKYKEVEEEKIKNELNKLDIEKQQFEKEKQLTLETIENNKKEFEIEKEHYEKMKQIEEQKLKAERENLNKNCERFKRLITGLSTNFNKIPNE